MAGDSKLTDKVDQVKDVMLRQVAAAKKNGMADQVTGMNEMVGRIEERFGFNRDDAVRTVQDLFETYGDDVLNLIEKKTPLPIRRRKRNRRKKALMVVSVVLSVLTAVRWFMQNSDKELSLPDNITRVVKENLYSRPAEQNHTSGEMSYSEPTAESNA